jgi:hypothetical protein
MAKQCRCEGKREDASETYKGGLTEIGGVSAPSRREDEANERRRRQTGSPNDHEDDKSLRI